MLGGLNILTDALVCSQIGFIILNIGIVLLANACKKAESEESSE